MTKNNNITLDLEFQVFNYVYLVLPLAICALQPQHQLLGGLGLLPQDGLGLTSESLLLAIIPEDEDIINMKHRGKLFIIAIFTTTLFEGEIPRDNQL